MSKYFGLDDKSTELGFKIIGQFLTMAAICITMNSTNNQ